LLARIADWKALLESALPLVPRQSLGTRGWIARKDILPHKWRRGGWGIA